MRFSTSSFLLVAGVTCSLTGAAFAATAGWSKIDAVPGFSGWRKELQRLVDRDSSSRINHVCVVVERFRPPRGRADTKPPPVVRLGRVYWREGHRLIAWDASAADVDASSARPGNDLDLWKDVRATEAEVGTSTYLVTRAWVTNVIQHCAKDGTQLVITKGQG